MARKSRPTAERITEYIATDQASGCWVWTGPLSSGGYPVLKIGGEKALVRPLIYRLARGEPESRFTARPQIRMACGKQPCVNPDHMVVLTDEDRELQQIRQELFLEGRRLMRIRGRDDPRARRRLHPGYIEWRSQKILQGRLAERNAAQSPEVLRILHAIRTREFAQGAVPAGR
jgi:hypothetical protein